MTSIFLIKDKSKKEKPKICIMRFLKRSQAVTMIEPLAPILHIMPSTSLLAFTTKQMPLQEKRKSRFSFWKSCAIIASPNSFSYTEEETNMTIAEIRALGLMEEAVAELSGGDDKAEIVRASLVCPLCGMAETVWYCPATDKHVCVDCHYVW